MKSTAQNKPTHIVKGNIFDAFGFSASEASALKVKAEIFSSLLECIRDNGYTQSQLVDILDEYQPSVSNLLNGRISQVSIEKLLRYADQLHLETSISVRRVEKKRRPRKTTLKENGYRHIDHGSSDNISYRRIGCEMYEAAPRSTRHSRNTSA